MNNLILSKLFSGFNQLVIKKNFKTYGMPSLSKLLKKVENQKNTKVIFLIRSELLNENKYIIKKKINNYNKEIYFFNEYFFLKKKNFKLFFYCLNEILKITYLFYFIKKNKISNIRLDLSSIISISILSKIINFRMHLRLYGAYTINFQHNKNDIYSNFFRKACKLEFKSVICTNDGNSNIENLKSFLPNSKNIKLLFNGSDFLKEKSRNNFQLNLPINIIFVGRLNVLKGPLNFVKAAITIKKNFAKKFKFTIIGDGPERKKIISLIRSNGLMGCFKIYTKIDTQKVKTIMRNSDLLIAPSFVGYFSNVVLEATSLGLPVMTCNDKFNITTKPNFNKLQKKFNFQILENKNIYDQICKNLLKIINNPQYLYQMSRLQKIISKKNFKSWENVIKYEFNSEDFNEA